VTVVRSRARPEPCGSRAGRPARPVQRRAPVPPPGPKRDDEPGSLPARLARSRRGRHVGRRRCRVASAVLRLRPGLEFRRRRPGGVVVVDPPVGQFPQGGVSLHPGLPFHWRDSGRLLVVVPVLRLLSLGGGVLVVALGGGSRAGQVHGRHRGPDTDLECPASGVSAVELRHARQRASTASLTRSGTTAGNRSPADSSGPGAGSTARSSRWADPPAHPGRVRCTGFSAPTRPATAPCRGS
jgi:hypothetical protein